MKINLKTDKIEYFFMCFPFFITIKYNQLELINGLFTR
jgi:hypothetical protein